MIEETIDWLLLKFPSHVSPGMLHDAERIFCTDPSWSSSSVRITENPRCKIELVSTISGKFTDIMDVLAVQASLFQKLGYRNFTVTSEKRYEKAAVLRFVTIPKSSLHCVTGRIISGGPNYDLLAEKWTAEGKPKLLYADFDGLF